MTRVGGAIDWVDDRTGLARIGRSAMAKVFPDHWAFLLGEVALFCFLILLASGTFLTFFYVPSSEQMGYSGSWLPLLGSDVSAAYSSVLHLSLEVRAGLLIRQLHHWTALVFVGVIVVHMSRVFITGAFRRPRDLNWMVGIGLMLLALAEGFTGYSLPDDLLSGTGLRITYSAAMSIPFVGPDLAFLIFGGEFPTSAMISRLFVFHVLLLPGLFVAAIATHIGLTWIQKHTMFPGRGATERTVVGPPFWPIQVFRSLGLMALTGAVLVLLAGFVQINPVWQYGPYLPYVSTVPAQPDWYVGWLEGSLRLGLPFEPTVLGVTIPSPFLPAIVIPGVLFTILFLWPFLERHVTHDDLPHHILQWPWEAPWRSAIGAAILTFFGVQTLAGANDVLSQFLSLDIDTLTLALQLAQVALPILVGWLVLTWCRDRRRRHSPPGGTRPVGVVLIRDASGGFTGQPLDRPADSPEVAT